MSWTTKAHDLERAQAQQVAAILRDLDPDDTRTLNDAKVYGSPAGHEQKLRGIPVTGVKGVGGTMHDTDPLRALMSKQPREASKTPSSTGQHYSAVSRAGKAPSTRTAHSTSAPQLSSYPIAAPAPSSSTASRPLTSPATATHGEAHYSERQPTSSATGQSQH